MHNIRQVQPELYIQQIPDQGQPLREHHWNIEEGCYCRLSMQCSSSVQEHGIQGGGLEEIKWEGQTWPMALRTCGGS